MPTVGQKMDEPNEYEDHMTAYYEFIELQTENVLLSSRIRYMLFDLVEQSANGWGKLPYLNQSRSFRYAKKHSFPQQHARHLLKTC